MLCNPLLWQVFVHTL